MKEAKDMLFDRYGNRMTPFIENCQCTRNDQSEKIMSDIYVLLGRIILGVCLVFVPTNLAKLSPIDRKNYNVLHYVTMRYVKEYLSYVWQWKKAFPGDLTVSHSSKGHAKKMVSGPPYGWSAHTSSKATVQSAPQVGKTNDTHKDGEQFLILTVL